MLQVQEVVVLLTPEQIGKLNMGRKRKIQASLIFLFSAFAVVAGLLRMIIMLQIRVEDTVHPTTRILGTDLMTVDQVGVISILLFWTYIEIGVGFVVASLPPSARYLDKFSIQPLLAGLRSLTSLRTMLSSRRSRTSDEERRAPSEISQESWERLKHMRDEYQMTNMSAGEAA
ncbi:hypothetical protein Daus18300_013752 [Diaporthe australafricana]|uniref:Rhodopsin domain-containing protein n=1 Tax=Diaporthe australafricana TaxID=127596 RepID=A0ABR3VXV2_9PEZI